MAYIEYDGTDLEVEVVEKVNGNEIKVRAKVGYPFGERMDGKMVRRCFKNEIIIDKNQLRVEQ